MNLTKNLCCSYTKKRVVSILKKQEGKVFEVMKCSQGNNTSLTKNKESPPALSIELFISDFIG